MHDMGVHDMGVNDMGVNGMGVHDEGMANAGIQNARLPWHQKAVRFFGNKKCINVPTLKYPFFLLYISC
jgi:hypothetical protein